MFSALVDLKGLAVRRMNAAPTLLLNAGHNLPRSFVIETEHRWGFAALRFGESVHLLLISALPAFPFPLATSVTIRMNWGEAIMRATFSLLNYEIQRELELILDPEPDEEPED